jgi:hypothetical protein
MADCALADDVLPIYDVSDAVATVAKSETTNSRVAARESVIVTARLAA